MRFGVKLCGDCAKGFDSVFAGDPVAAEYYSDPENFPNATYAANKNIVGVVMRHCNKQTEQPAVKAEASLVSPSVAVQQTHKASTGEGGKSIGTKIKELALAIFVLETIVAILAGFGVIIGDADMTMWGLLVMVIGPLLAWPLFLFLSGFGELVEKTSKNEENTRKILEHLENNGK